MKNDNDIGVGTKVCRDLVSLEPAERTKRAECVEWPHYSYFVPTNGNFCYL